MRGIQTTVINRINDIPIRAKFLWIYFVLILLPMIVVYLIFFSQLQEEVTLREESVINQSIDRVISETEYLVDGCLSIARDIALDQNINEILEQDYGDSSDYFAVYFETLQDKILMYASGYNNVVRVSTYTNNYSLLNGGNVYTISPAIEASDWLMSIKNQNSKNTIVSWIEPHPYNRDHYFNRVSVVRIMDEFAEYKKEKYVRIDIEEMKLSKILDSVYGMEFIVTDEDNRIVSMSNSDNYNKTGEPTYFDSKDYEVSKTIMKRSFQPVKEVTWYLYAIGPKQTLAGEFNQYANLIIWMFMVSLALSVLLIYIFTRTYTSRIHLLKNHMQKVEKSEFDLIEDEQGKDEIGSLIGAFNAMTMQINGLVNEVLKYKIKEKDHQLEQVKAELKFLQSQMDPHFLFNTLNAILVVSSRNGYDEITDIIKNLAKTLRYLIEWDHNMIAIEKELAFTKMYLEIEKFRFRDKFDFTLNIEKGLEEVLIPKLTIQPFIENACKHGLQPSKDKGRLSVNVYSIQKYIHVIIEDNGVGMSKDVYQDMIANKSDGHIGIQNVMKRLEIHYGHDHILQITSQEKIGTKVFIKLPIKINEGGDSNENYEQ